MKVPCDVQAKTIWPVGSDLICLHSTAELLFNWETFASNEMKNIPMKCDFFEERQNVNINYNEKRNQ